MEALSAYIPTDRRHALARGEQLPDRVHGTALFVDISGFTPLAEMLARDLGPHRGAEQLTLHLNRVYDVLIAELDCHRGSVIGFSGDAITCWFDSDRGLAATACALRMQRAMEKLGTVELPTGEELSLSAKAGLAVGVARRFLVGDPDRQLIDVLAGRLLDEMADAEHQAGPGEVVLAPSAMEALQGWVEISRQQHADDRMFYTVGELKAEVEVDPWPELATDAFTEAQVRPWLLGPVYERLQAGQGEFLAELRPAVAHFLRFEGIDYDLDESAGGRLDGFIRQVQRIVGAYDGTLVDLTTGDKGSYLYLAFGAPRAHEDDVERAASTALDLRTAVSDLPYITSIQIGISRGRMRTGAYGGRTRRTYGVLGDATNLAARLMTAARPGEILLSRAAFEAVSPIFTWQVHPDLKVKGKSEPVRVVSLDGRSRLRGQAGPEPRRLLPMVGREKELAHIEEKLRLALEGHGQIVGITAEAGVGKSRLLSEAVHFAQTQGHAVYAGECKSYATHSSYLVWSGIWRSLFGLDASLSTRAQVSALQAQVGRLSSLLLPRLPLLGALLNLTIPDNDLTQLFAANLRKTSLESMAADLLRARAGETPMILVLEDTHWIDSLSRDLLEVLGRALASEPVLMLLAYRTADASEAGPHHLAKFSHFHEIRLTNLAERQAAEWIALKVGQLYGPNLRPPSAFVERLLGRAEGNPFYIEEVLNYLKDSGVSPEDSAAFSRLDLPASLHSLVLTRIDQLPEHPRSTLRVASVFGRSFKAGDLSGAYPQLTPDRSLQGELRELERKGFTQVGSTAQQSYLFRHGVIQEVAYESLSFDLRQRLHGSIGEYIERAYSQSLAQQTDLLAYHYFRGQVWPKALDYNLEAALRAKRGFANHAAIGAGEQALEAASKLEPHAETNSKILAAHEVLGEVLTLVGEYEGALAHYGAARGLIESDAPLTGARPQRLADLCRGTAGVYERRSEYLTALEWLDRGLGFLEANVPTIERVRLEILRSGIFSRQGRYEEAAGWAEGSLVLAAAISTREGRQATAQISYLLGGIYYRQGTLDRAVEYCQQSVAAYEEIEDVPGQARAYNNLGSTYRLKGDWSHASQALQRSLEINRRIDDIQEQGAVTNNLGNIYLDQGDWERAAEHFQESNSIWKRLGAVLPDAITLSNLGQVYIREGRLPEAEAALSQSQTLYEQAGSASLLPEQDRRWAEYHLAGGSLSQALESVLRSIDLARAQEARFELGVSLRVLGQVQLASKNFDAAQVALGEGLSILEERDSEFEAARVRLAVAELAAARGSPIDRERLQATIDTFARLGARQELDQARLLAERLGGLGL